MGSYLILYWKNIEGLPENLEYAEMRHGDVIKKLKHYNDVTDRRAADMFVINLSHGLVQVGENNGNLDLVCENKFC